MNQTANYGLNQWDEQDRILREDFNADNAKIEAALAALTKASAYEKLLSVTTTENQNEIALDLSGIDLTQFRKLELDIHLGSDGGTPDSYANTIRLRWDDETTHFASISYPGVLSESMALLCVHMFLGQQLAIMSDKVYNTTNGFVTDFNVYSGMISANLSGVHTLRLAGWYSAYTSYANPLPAGTRVTLCGIK